MSVGRHDRDPGRGELDRERDAVEPTADLGDRVRVRRRRARSRAAPRCARSANSCTASLGHRPRRAIDVRAGSSSDAQRPHLLAGDAERLATGRQDAHAGAVAQQPLGEPADRFDEVLAVVEHEHELAQAQRVDDARRRACVAGRASTPSVAATTCAELLGVAARSRARTTTRRRGSAGAMSSATWIAMRLFPTPPTPVTVTSRDASSASAIASRSTARPTNDVSCPGRLPGIASSDRSGGNSRAQPGGDDLEDALRAREVGQPVLAEVDERDLVGQRVAHDLLGGVRHHHLSAVGRRPSPGRPGWWRGRSSRRRGRPRRRCGGPCAPAARRARPTARRRAPAGRRGRRRAASRVVANTAWRPSPVVFTTWPPCPLDRVAEDARRGARAPARIAAGCCSQSRVEPSRSVNRNVTVPDGSSGTAPPRQVARTLRMIARRWRIPCAESGARPSGGTPYPRRHARRTRPVDRARVACSPSSSTTRARRTAAAAAAEADGEAAAERAGEQISSPTKLIRIASMVRTMLDEVRRAPLDDAGRRRLARDPRAVARGARGRALARPPPGAQRGRAARSPATTPTESELRLAQAQLVGWLEGLFHGIQATLFTQQAIGAGPARPDAPPRASSPAAGRPPVRAGTCERRPGADAATPTASCSTCSSGPPTAGARSRPSSSPTGPTPPRSTRALADAARGAAARVRRRGAQPHRRARRGHRAARLRAAGRRLRRVVRRVLGQRHPRQAEGHPADGRRAHVRQRRAHGEDRPHRRTVRQAPLVAHRDARRRRAPLVPRRHGERLRVRGRRPAAPIPTGSCARTTRPRPR